MWSVIFGIVAGLTVLGFILGMIFVGAGVIFEIVAFGFKLALVAIPLGLAYGLARLLFGF